MVNSAPPQLLETNLAPSRTAVSSAALRLPVDVLFDSTRMILHLGQIAETMSRSSDSSSAQPELPFGYQAVVPFWLTTRRHLVDSLQAPSP